MLGSLVPTHECALALKGFNEDDGLGHGHGEAIGECFVVEWLTSLLENRVSLLRFIINDVLDSQRARCVGKDDGRSRCCDHVRGSWRCSSQGGDLGLQGLDEREELFDGWHVGCHGLSLSPGGDGNGGRW